MGSSRSCAATSCNFIFILSLAFILQTTVSEWFLGSPHQSPNLRESPVVCLLARLIAAEGSRAAGPRVESAEAQVVSATQATWSAGCGALARRATRLGRIASSGRRGRRHNARLGSGAIAVHGCALHRAAFPGGGGNECDDDNHPVLAASAAGTSHWPSPGSKSRIKRRLCGSSRSGSSSGDGGGRHADGRFERQGGRHRRKGGDSRG